MFQALLSTSVQSSNIWPCNSFSPNPLQRLSFSLQLPPGWWVCCHEGPPGMALLSLGHCHWYFSLRWWLAEGLHKKRSQIPGTILPLQHTDHFYSPVNNHCVSYLVLKPCSLLKGTVVEDYLKISAKTVHIFPLKNCKNAEDQSFTLSNSACVSWQEKSSTAGGWICWTSNCNSLKQLRAEKWLLLLR